jgi:hypothetical protein
MFFSCCVVSKCASGCARTSVAIAVIAWKMTPCTVTRPWAYLATTEPNKHCQRQLAGSSLPKSQVSADLHRSYDGWTLARDTRKVKVALADVATVESSASDEVGNPVLQYLVKAE